MAKFLGNKRKRQLLRSLFADPLPEGHLVDRDSFSFLTREGTLVVRLSCAIRVNRADSGPIRANGP